MHLRSYEAACRELRDTVMNWAWSGKRVLDFGCGAGRTLRHFVEEAQVAEFSGCDIHGGSVDWINANLNQTPRAGFEPAT